MSVSATSNSTAKDAEQRARDYLAQGEWRKARDELKPLVKLDRSRYLPLLLQANIGLARAMQAKGQVAEAQQVLSHLASIASAEELRSAEAEFSSKSQTPAVNLGPLVRALVNQVAAEPEEALADQLVVAFQPLTTQDPAEMRVATELRAIHDGLLAVSMQHWERLPEILRVIPHRSAFAHWGAFIKGLAAFHTGAKERATRFLSALPPGTVPAKASQCYLLFLGAQATPPRKAGLTELVMEGACRLLGQPGAGRLLMKADQLWKKERRPSESYRVLRNGLPNFPTREVNWLGALTDFYFNASQTLPERERDDLTDYLEDLRDRSQTKNGTEELLIHRLFALNGADLFEWEEFLRKHERLYQANPRFASLAYTQLGLRMARSDSSAGRFFPREPSGLEGTSGCLEKAIALDPDNLEAHLGLANCYIAGRHKNKLNRLLDQMVQRFPDEKRVLLSAATGCLERNACVKGLDYLERARSLDQLDPKIPELIIGARRKLAQQYFQQRRLDKARQSFAVFEPDLNDKLDDFQRSRWTNRLRLGLMEQQWGDRSQGQVLIAQARQASPSSAAFLLFAHLAQRVYAGIPGKATEFWPELTAELKTAPELGKAVLLIRLIEFWERGATLQLGREEQLVQKYTKASAKRPFTREEARQAIEAKLEDWEWRGELQEIVKKVLRKDQLDPLFRLYHLLLRGQLTRDPFGCRAKLESILEEAGRRGDEATAQRVRQAMKRLETPKPFPFPPLPEPDFEEDEDDFELGGMQDILNELPPEAGLELMLLLNAMANMPESELRRVRQKRPKDIPADVFDMLLELAKSGRIPPMPPPFTPPQPDRRKVRPSSAEISDEFEDPNQGKLF